MTKYVETIVLYVCVVIYCYNNYIFLMKLMPGSPFNDTNLMRNKRNIK